MEKNLFNYFQDKDKEQLVNIGCISRINYDRATVITNDKLKREALGIPQSSFLLAFRKPEGGKYVNECILLRVLNKADMTSDRDSEYYLIEMFSSNRTDELDAISKAKYSTTGLECSILGTFYEEDGKLIFGADLENYMSPYNYEVYKPKADALKQIVNYNDNIDAIKNVEIGNVRYSSSRYYQDQEELVPVYVHPEDFLGKRTALFGMTRTGKSNTIKKIIECTEELGAVKMPGTNRYKYAGQIIFDINGEYANANVQDEGTAIFNKFHEKTTRFSTIEKPGFEVLRLNFYKDVEEGFNFICNYLDTQTTGGDYINNFKNVDLSKPEPRDGDTDFSAGNNYHINLAAYKCVLYKAGFDCDNSMLIRFKVNSGIRDAVDHYITDILNIKDYKPINPDKGLTIAEAKTYFERLAMAATNKSYVGASTIMEWLEDREDLKSLLTFLIGKKIGGGGTVNGYQKLNNPTLKNMHTRSEGELYSKKILKLLRCEAEDEWDDEHSNIVIIDLSEGDPETQGTFIENLCTHIFQDSMHNFTSSNQTDREKNNFIQMYFEEAHNLLSRDKTKDLSNIYNRIAKEGAKLNLGLIYSTQEVTSLSPNVLKNTQNWFVAHLNSEEEINELKKFYDFKDFANSLVKYSSGSDKGFVRMKTYSNPFIVPTQINKFTA